MDLPVDSQKQNIEKLIEKAISLKQKGNLPEAISIAQKSINLDPNYYKSYYHLGEFYTGSNSLKLAEEAFRVSIQLNPQFPSAYCELGNILHQQQNFDEAQKVYELALELGYENSKLYSNLGSIYLTNKQWHNAVTHYRKAVKFESIPWNHYNLGFALQKQDKSSEAIYSYAQALQIDPNFSPAYQQLMFSELESQQLNEVVKAFQYNIQQQPGASWLYTRLGDLLSKQGQIPEAIQTYKDATYKLNLWLKPEYTKNYWHQGEVKGPDFMIIGAMKAGTTSLYKYINQHPKVLPCAQKEVHFFVHHFEKGLDWYLAHFPAVLPGENYLTGEASPGYLCNTIQEKVKDTFPQAKLIAVLRNPVERAISHYYHNVKHGIEMRSFEAAMRDEMDAIATLPEIDLVKETKNWSGQQGYLFIGLYVYFLQKWMEKFPREQFLIVQSENLYQKSQATMKKVFSFLELPAFEREDYINHLPGSYQKLNYSDSKYKLIADFFDVHNQRLTYFVQQPFSWM